MILIMLLLPPLAVNALLRENPRDRLDRIRHEVDSLTVIVQDMSNTERDLSDRIQALDKQINARQSLIRELDVQRSNAQAEVSKQDRLIRAQQAELADVNGELSGTRQDIEDLQAQVAARAVHLYKQGDRRILSYVLNAESPGEFLQRQVYVRKIHQRDENNLSALAKAKNNLEVIASRHLNLIASLAESRTEKETQARRAEVLLAEANTERDLIKADRSSLQVTISDLRVSRDAINSHIQTRRSAMDEVQQWIAALEQQRVTGGVQQVGINSNTQVLIREVPKFSSFPNAKGQLPWPVDGSVVTWFGMERNSDTGTITENPGIDIQAREGSEVLAVQEGICTRITYVRGFGNTVLISHEDGYYTVYAHLANIFIGENEQIDAGRVIGTVGQSGGAESPRLHFQVWHKQEKQDPLTWLSS
ncbi:murein hydrolase activator NlpD precursor [bacterium BMS3Bbin04]|nr:murein hydrolase activator NlpD precursor [bacterium BMS3Bbin04]